MRRLWSNENVRALILALLLLILIVLTSDTSPRWIYQGF
jgi:hypothetical protein